MGLSPLNDYMDEIGDSPAALLTHWKKIRELIVQEHQHVAKDPEQKACILRMRHALMDLVENNEVAPEDLEKFRKARRDEYNMLLISEALRPDGLVEPDSLLAVTQREVAAGRMHADDELHRLALEGYATIGRAPDAPTPREIPTPRKTPTNLWKAALYGAIFMVALHSISYAASGAHLVPGDYFLPTTAEQAANFVGYIGFGAMLFTGVAWIGNTRGGKHRKTR
jgi:hypothetical protein